MKPQITVLVNVLDYVDELEQNINMAIENGDLLLDKILEMPEIVAKIKENVLDSLFKDYAEFYENVLDSCSKNKSKEDIIQNYKEIYDTILLFKEKTYKLISEMSERYGHCPCCGNDTLYLPREQQNEQKTNKDVLVELQNKKYICTECGATDRERFIVTFLKKINLATTVEGTTVLQIAPSESIDKWIKKWCTLIRYDVLDSFKEENKLNENLENIKKILDKSYDVIICSKVSDSVKNDRRFIEEMKRILKDDGEIIFMASFGCNEVKTVKEILYVNELRKEYFDEKDFFDSGLSENSPLCVLTKTNDVELDKGYKPVINQDLCKNGPLVSVILPCYNHEKYVRRAIESVINQSYKNIEFIVCDDGSDDHTPDIMKEYSKYYAKEYYFKENLRARSEELSSVATGKYIALMHSDDVWEKDKLAIQVDYLEKHGGICLTWANYVDDDEEVIENAVFYKKNRSRIEWLKFLWFNGNCFCNPSLVMEREMFLEKQKHGYQCKQVPDFFKWIDFICKYDIHLITLPLTKMGVHYYGKNLNDSAPTEENWTRTYLEDGIVWMQVLEDMDDELFVQTFRDLFVRKDANTREELLCERYFMLLNNELLARKISAIYYMHRHGNDMNKCLIEKYGYTRIDFARDELEKSYAKFLKNEDFFIEKK
ncbi:Glycosyltransferase involved in cell wall bisynthesis [Lachnospiraceae bacterium C7]|nr:Glycosyltransferase involved in cell wall bisynthesis [Lachnospiraceae bacterium C7]